MRRFERHMRYGSITKRWEQDTRKKVRSVAYDGTVFEPTFFGMLKESYLIHVTQKEGKTITLNLKQLPITTILISDFKKKRSWSTRTHWRWENCGFGTRFARPLRLSSVPEVEKFFSKKHFASDEDAERRLEEYFQSSSRMLLPGRNTQF